MVTSNRSWFAELDFGIRELDFSIRELGSPWRTRGSVMACCGGEGRRGVIAQRSKSYG